MSDFEFDLTDEQSSDYGFWSEKLGPDESKWGDGILDFYAREEEKVDEHVVDPTSKWVKQKVDENNPLRTFMARYEPEPGDFRNAQNTLVSLALEDYETGDPEYYDALDQATNAFFTTALSVALGPIGGLVFQGLSKAWDYLMEEYGASPYLAAEHFLPMRPYPNWSTQNAEQRDKIWIDEYTKAHMLKGVPLTWGEANQYWNSGEFHSDIKAARDKGVQLKSQPAYRDLTKTMFPMTNMVMSSYKGGAPIQNWMRNAVKTFMSDPSYPFRWVNGNPYSRDAVMTRLGGRTNVDLKQIPEWMPIEQAYPMSYIYVDFAFSGLDPEDIEKIGLGSPFFGLPSSMWNELSDDDKRKMLANAVVIAAAAGMSEPREFWNVYNALAGLATESGVARKPSVNGYLNNQDITDAVVRMIAQVKGYGYISKHLTSLSSGAPIVITGDVAGALLDRARQKGMQIAIDESASEGTKTGMGSGAKAALIVGGVAVGGYALKKLFWK